MIKDILFGKKCEVCGVRGRGHYLDIHHEKWLERQVCDKCKKPNQIMNKEQNNWEKKFDEKFPSYVDTYGKKVLDMEQPKDFIKTLLEDMKKETLEKIEKRINTEEDTSWGDVRRNLQDYLNNLKKEIRDENT